MSLLLDIKPNWYSVFIQTIWLFRSGSCAIQTRTYGYRIILQCFTRWYCHMDSKWPLYLTHICVKSTLWDIINLFHGNGLLLLNSKIVIVKKLFLGDYSEEDMAIWMIRAISTRCDLLRNAYENKAEEDVISFIIGCFRACLYKTCYCFPLPLLWRIYKLYPTL